MKGVDPRTVQELVGHKNVQMACPYEQLAPEHKQAAVEKLCEMEYQAATKWCSRWNFQLTPKLTPLLRRGCKLLKGP